MIMKRLFFILFLVFFTGCDSDTAWDCVKASGTIYQEEIIIEMFTKIDVRHRVQLIVEQGDKQKVVLETGENLRKKIHFSVADGRLLIEDDNKCNLFRDYGITKVYVTSPDITEIRNGSGLTVESRGVLRFPNLALLSDDTFNDEDYHTDGNFILNVETENFSITANGISNYYISGSAVNANIGLYSGAGRFEGANFTVQNVRVFHRSSNKIIVNPQESLSGEIRSTGNLISVNRPPVVNVEQYYTGRLIFQD